jgi:uncharacterized coiled-coil DUF342 family protein
MKTKLQSDGTIMPRSSAAIGCAVATFDIMPAEKIPEWIERLLLPKLSEISGELKDIRGELKAINTRIDATDDKIGSLRNETKTEITSVRTEIVGIRNEIASLKNEMTVRLDSIEKRIPIIEEITALKLKIADIERRQAVAIE